MTTPLPSPRDRSADLLAEARKVQLTPPHPAIGARILRQIERRSVEKSAKRRAVRWAALAAFGGAAGATVLVWSSLGSHDPELVGGAVLADGARRSIGDRLALGSRIAAPETAVVAAGPASITLAAGARITIDSPERLRLIEGEATFEVARLKPGRVLTIDAGQAEIRVIGTRFTVTRREDDVRVQVIAGEVDVKRDGQRWRVLAGASWPPTPSAPEARPVIEPVPDPVTPPIPTLPSRANRAPLVAAPTLERAAALSRAGDLDGARDTYRTIADAGGASAPLALYLLAELERTRFSDPKAALTLLDELDRRFPSQPLLRESRSSRLEVLLALGRCGAAEAILADLSNDPEERERLLHAPANVRSACGGAIERILLGDH